MLTIRPDQMRVLGSLPFENRMLAHLRTHFPEVCARLGDVNTIQRIRAGIAEAQGFGIADQRGICLYLSVGFALGPGFADNPAMGWAREVLHGPTVQNNVPKAVRLSRLAVEHLVFDAPDGLLAQAGWIEVQLVDEDDRGVPDEPYWIRFPDGAIREGRLNQDGFVRFDGIPRGQCTVRFPQMGGDEIFGKTSLPEDKKDWVEIVLLDEASQPLAGERYTMTLPGGAVVEGALDEKGYARVNGIKPGQCKVVFPNIDQADFLEA